jgi:hypothetical protein
LWPGAALASASSGAKTLLLEARAFFGGAAAVSGWMPMNRLLLNGKSRGGIHEIFVGKLKTMGYRSKKNTEPSAGYEG